MKVSRFIALCLLVPLGGLAVAVSLHAQAVPAPKVVPPDLVQPDPNTPAVGVGRPGPAQFGQQGPTQHTRAQYYRSPWGDPKTAQFMGDELAADQEARALAAQYAQAASDEQRAEAKKKLREKLASIFELQQKRRTAEITSIEERLAKLKEVSKKREANKDPIVDRRLDQLTGGTDELGWEESGGGSVRYSTGSAGVIEVPVHGDYGVEPTTNHFPVPAVPAPGTTPLPTVPRGKR